MILSWHQASDDFLLKARVVGYLHDIVEDTKVTMKDLWSYKFPTDCILAIEILTKVEGVSYQEYLAGVKRYKLAAVVKVTDMLHNSDLTRLNHVTARDRERQKKYLIAIDYLSEFTCEKCGCTLPLSDMGEKATRIGEILCQNCLEQYENEYDAGENWLNSYLDKL
jgi:hypothetical protein